MQSKEGIRLHKLWTLRYLKMVKNMQTTYLDVVIALEVAYMEAEQWFNNTHQKGAAELSGKSAKWFWDRQATLIRHKVTYEEQMAEQ